MSDIEKLKRIYIDEQISFIKTLNAIDESLDMQRYQEARNTIETTYILLKSYPIKDIEGLK